MRTEFDPAGTGPRGFYQLLTSLITPRPIAGVSTRSRVRYSDWTQSGNIDPESRDAS